MSSWAGPRRKAHLDDPTDTRCSFPYCLSCVTNRFMEYNIPFCQEHALYVWSGVNEMMQIHELDTTPKEPPAKREEGWVYYLRIGDRVKIGYTNDVDRRLASYPPNMEVLLLRRGTRNLERAEHLRFAEHLRDGREWFDANDAVLSTIEEIASRVPVAERWNDSEEWFRRRTRQPRGA